MISNIPGFSEEKAVAVVKEYPDIVSLINKVESANTMSDKGRLFENIEIEKLNQNYKNGKRLGEHLSKKLVRMLTSLDENEII